MFIVLGLLLLVLGCVIVTWVAWASDERAGRSRWMKIERSQEFFALGKGAFREATVTVHRAHFSRDRAPCFVRLLALSCYVPLGACVPMGIPWLLGVAFLFHHAASEWACDLWANALLVSAYPFGCWAAARMHHLGRALLGGEVATFRRALISASTVVVPFNVAIVAGALVLALRFTHHDTAWWVTVVPCMTLVQLALIAAVGRYAFGRDQWSSSPGGRGATVPLAGRETTP